MTLTLFDGPRRVLSGDLAEVTNAARILGPAARLLAFDDETGAQVDLDPRNLPPAAGKGRPKLGVVPREVTLLPRHWDWLNRQPGGASVALRKMVEAARRDPAEQWRSRRDATYAFVRSIAGNEVGFEEAIRTLYNADREGFLANTETWPSDVRNHALDLAGWA